MDKKRSFSVSGMHCAGCASAVERAIKTLPGVSDIYVSFASGRLNFVSQEDTPSDEEVILAVKKAGFKAELPPPPLVAEKRPDFIRQWINWLVSAFFTTLLMIVCMGNIPADPRLNGAVQLLLLLPVLLAGRGFFLRGIPALFRLSPNMDSLISVSSLSGIVYSFYLMITSPESHLFFDAAAMIVTLIMLGKLLESRSRYSASAAIRQLLELTPPSAHLIKGNDVVDVPSAGLQSGDLIRVLPGEKIPADGTVIRGKSFVNEAMLTGEELPAAKEIDSKVYCGTLNADGVLEVKVTSTGQASFLGQIVALIREAQNSRPPVAVMADKVSGVFVWGIFAIAGITAVCWGIGGTGEEALNFSLSVLVVACPCALGLATPVALISGIGRAAESGILIKNGSALEKAAKLSQLVFDKTGTLTAGIPELRQIHLAPDFPEEKFLSAALAIEKNSSHPLAFAVVSGGARRGIKAEKPVSGFKNLPGRGVQGVYDGKLWLFGNAAMMLESGVDLPELPESMSGETLIFGACDGVFAGVMAIGDSLREEACLVIKKLHSLGIKCGMLTGDNLQSAAKAAAALDLDWYEAGLLPQDKVKFLREKCAGDRLCGMVGDGINDAPALAAGDPGIAIGSGSDIAIESADVVLMRPDLRETVRLIVLSRSTFRVIKQNLFWAFFYNICGIPLAAGVFSLFGGPVLNPAFCAGAMACSSLTVVLNALRLRYFRVKDL